MDTARSRIEQIRSGGFELDFTDTFNETFEIYKKIAVNAGLLFIIIAIVGTIVIIGLTGAIVGFAAITESLAGFNPAAEKSPTYIVGYILFISALSGFFAPVTAGIIKMARQADHNEPFSIGTAFDYYSSPYFKELFLALFLTGLFTSSMNSLSEVIGLSFIGIIVSVVVAFITFLTIPLIIFGDLKSIEAIRGSIIIVSRQPWIILGLLIVTILASFVGFIALCIGYFFTVPIVYALYYTIYKHAIGIKQNSEIDQIGL